MRPINPFVSRIKEFPGRIFLFDTFDEDVQAVLACCNGKKVFVEIGSGSGAHLLELGRRAPEAVFFGFELRFKRAVRTIEKCNKAGVHNVFVLHVDARRWGELFPAGALSGVFINFPDPWPKKKQIKHRMLTDAWLANAAQLLTPGGLLRLKTDHRDHALALEDLVSRQAAFSLVETTDDLHRSELASENILTEFERLFLSQGKSIYVRTLCRA